MIGLAQMAWKLAQLRTYPSPRSAPHPRDSVSVRFIHGPSAEYYRIIDEAERAWRVNGAWRNCGLTVRL